MRVRVRVRVRVRLDLQVLALQVPVPRGGKLERAHECILELLKLREAARDEEPGQQLHRGDLGDARLGWG